VEASAGIGLDLSLSLFLLVGVILVPLLARYLPTPDDDLAVVRPMLVLALAWLLTTPSWRPWYDALMFPLLALMPATALDGLLLLRSALGGIGTSPGVGPVSRWPIPWLRQTFNPWVVSSALLAVFAVIVSRLVAAPRLRRSRPRVVAGSRRH